MDTSLVSIALKKGARVKITPFGPVLAVVVTAFGREVGRFVFNRKQEIVKSLVIEKSFYPQELAIAEVKKFLLIPSYSATPIEKIVHTDIQSETVVEQAEIVPEKKTRKYRRKKVGIDSTIS
jgi:hypothetical protein